jgi:hypothetical protein
MKRAHCVLLVILLCSCTAHRGGSEAADSERIRFLDRSDPVVEYTFAIMAVRAERSEIRENHRARGERVCEEGEHGTSWQEGCNTCRCERGTRHCPSLPCKSPESAAKFRAEMQDYNRRKAERDRALQEKDRARGLRVCEIGEHGTRWQEGSDTCWCERGIRRCTGEGSLWLAPPPHWPGPPPRTEPSDKEQPPRDYREISQSLSRTLCKEDEIGTYWQLGCNTCWCEAGGRVCSKADCQAAP